MSDTLENGLFDIPDYEHIEDEPFPPLPPPFSPGQAGEDGDPFTNGEEDGDTSRLAEVPAAKRRVKRPQPKLDSQRLTSERGLPALRTLFDNVNFKGKGHEAEDLRELMQRMENWAHRLYPKLQFDDFIDKLETLGGKKDVQTCLKRIRLGMPLTHEDFICKDGEEDVAVAREDRIQEDLDPFGDAGFPEEPLRLVHSTPAAPLLTEEQQRRIMLNKQLALERRQARMQQHSDSSQLMSLSMSAEAPSTSSSSHFHSQQCSGGADDDMEPDQRKSSADSANSPRHKGSLPSPDSALPEREGRHSPISELSNDCH